MIILRDLANDTPELIHSRLLLAMQRSFQYIDDNGSIGLTKSKAFNRKFAHWAAEHFDWPEYSLSELLIMNKVLNEEDVPPAALVHDLMLLTKLGRPYKDTFRMTKKAKELAKDPGKLFAKLANTYLFQYNHNRMSRFDDVAPGNWDVFLNVINVEVEGGATEAELVEAFYGITETPGTFDREYSWYRSSLFTNVLRPLTWVGFLAETCDGEGLLAPRVYTKTPLWRVCLQLDTDDMIKAPILH